MHSRSPSEHLADPKALLPDFRRPANLIYVVLGAAAIALIAGQSAWQPGTNWRIAFGLVLLFVLWNALISAALLQGLRPLVAGRARWLQMLVIPLVLGVTTAIGSAMATWLMPEAIETLSPRAFLARNVMISLVVALLLARLLMIQADWQQRVAIESDVRLNALQARIRPHFMFNALNTIAELIHAEPTRAEEALLDLSDLLRTGLRDQARHSLAEELELVRGYLRLEGLRLGERLEIDWQLDEDLPMDLQIPALLIQPLVENAVVHGVAAMPSGGRLSIAGRRRRLSRLGFVIENPVPEDAGARTEGKRVALDNIRQRLALAYDEGAGLKVEREPGSFRVTLTLPLDG